MTVDQAGPMGWGDPHEDDPVRLDNERRELHKAQDAYPVAYRSRPAKSISPKMRDALKAAQDAKDAANPEPWVYTRDRRNSWAHNMSIMGRRVIDGEPLVDTLELLVIFDVVFGKSMSWFAQIIGSCVGSGWMRCSGTRITWEVAVGGDPEEPIGTTRLGVTSLMPFAPFSYGMGRKLVGMRRGDGSYCATQVNADQTVGLLPCSTPALKQIVGDRETDYPEPQNARLYRDFGSWQHLDDLKPYAGYRLLESVEVSTADQAVRSIVEEYKPQMICSNWAFKPSRKAKSGDRLIWVENQWGDKAHRDGAGFYVAEEEHDDWLKQASSQTIGDRDLPESKLPANW